VDAATGLALLALLPPLGILAGRLPLPRSLAAAARASGWSAFAALLSRAALLLAAGVVVALVATAGSV
jgi:hypothetical protein